MSDKLKPCQCAWCGREPSTWDRSSYGLYAKCPDNICVAGETWFPMVRWNCRAETPERRVLKAVLDRLDSCLIGASMIPQTKMAAETFQQATRIILDELYNEDITL